MPKARAKRSLAPHDEAADLFLEVRSNPFGDSRRVGRSVPSRPSIFSVNMLLVLHGLQRHVHPCHASDFRRPLASTIDDGFAGDVALIGGEATTALLGCEPR